MGTREDEKRGTREERSVMVKRGWGQSKSIVAFLHFCRSLRRCHWSWAVVQGLRHGYMSAVDRCTAEAVKRCYHTRTTVNRTK